MMNTPICDFVREYAERHPHRLHMPGHKGAGPLGVEHLDITEIDGADVLYAPDGIIAESQANAAALFGTAATLYSTEGSTLCIRGMLRLTALYAAMQGHTPRILAARNAHRAFLTAAALLDVEVTWVYPATDMTLLSCPLTAQELENHLATAEKLPTAVYVTSPDYLGNVAPISALAQVCHRYGVLLLVDNAHGAYLHFLPDPCHPIDQGADMCCDSAHKTLGVLTGGAYLHLSRQLPQTLLPHAADAMALFASTSPSYLILQSLDAANRALADGFSETIAHCAREVSTLKQRLTDAGYTLVGNEPLKITLDAKAYGYTGTDLAKRLAEQNIICEFSDPDYVVLMLSPYNTDEDITCLSQVLISLPRLTPLSARPPRLPRPVKALSPRQALFAPSAVCTVEDSVGCILSDAAVSCPPAVPVAVCGEVIDEDTVQLLHYYGTTHVRVVKQD